MAFASGTMSLAWALGTHAGPAEQPIKTTVKPDTVPSSELPYGDIVASGENPETATEPVISVNQEPEQGNEAPSEAMPEPAPSQEEGPQEDAGAEQTESPPPATAPTHKETPDNQAGSEQRATRTVHHDACKQVPVYRTVHHQASTPRELTVGGFTRIEWTSCPVCGQHHDSPYNERIVDHVSETYCQACGKKHAESYDEVIYL